jgi:hypothetical protein
MMATIAVGAAVSGGKTFTPDAVWSVAFWGSLAALFLGVGLVIVTRARGRSGVP